MNFLHEAFMQAVYAVGNSDPNPPVGAVLVGRNNKIIGSGYTQEYGSHHAEVMAIEDAKKNHGAESLYGSTLYVTLEPCNHYGKTPPCTKAIQENSIAKVVIACRDQTEKVNGADELQASGINVEWVAIEEHREELLWTIDGFHHAQKYKKPRVMLKWAQTRQGWLAPLDGPSGPITGALSREVVFRLRKLFHSTLATPGTVYQDHPLLNPRFDPRCTLPLDGAGFFDKLLHAFEEHYPEKFRTQNKRFFMLPRFDVKWREDDVIEYVNLQARLPGDVFFITEDPTQEKLLKALGQNVFYTPSYNDFNAILEYACSRGAVNLLVEAGPVFCEFLVEKSLADFLFIFKSNDELWEKGRGFSLSFLTAKNEDDKKKEAQIAEKGFVKLYDKDIGSDELTVYQKKKIT